MASGLNLSLNLQHTVYVDLRFEQSLRGTSEKTSPLPQAKRIQSNLFFSLLSSGLNHKAPVCDLMIREASSNRKRCSFPWLQ